MKPRERLLSLLGQAERLAEMMNAEHFQGGITGYERELNALYERWANRTANDIAEAPKDERDAILAAALIALAASMSTLQRKGVADAMLRGLGTTPPTPDLLRRMGDLIDENERAIALSLSPAIRIKLRQAMMDEDVLMALEQSTTAGKRALGGVLATLGARVGLYGGVWWAAKQLSELTQAAEKSEAIAWIRDPQANHCDTCLMYGDRTYDSMEAMLSETGGVTPAHGTLCGGNCRCELEGRESGTRVY